MDTTTARELTTEIYNAITPGTPHFVEFQFEMKAAGDDMELQGIEDYDLGDLLIAMEMTAPEHISNIAGEALDTGAY